MKLPRPAKGVDQRKVADRNRLVRRNHSISQAEVARRIGVSASAVAQWEHPSGTLPTLQNLLCILELTGASLDWLVTGKQHAPPGEHADVSTIPAVTLDDFAQTSQEEQLLATFREIPVRKRSLLIALAEEMMSKTKKKQSKRR